MERPGLDDRHRDKDGEISKTHGNTLVGTLRRIYGDSFARGFNDNMKLAHVLHTLDDELLSQMVHDHEHGRLEGKIKDAEKEPGTRSGW